MHLRTLFCTPPAILLAAVFHRLLEHESSQICCNKPLIISFSTKALRRLSESRRHAISKLGDLAAVALHARLADLLAAKVLTELPFGFEPSRDFPKRFSLSLGSSGHAVFESNHLRDRQAPAHQNTIWNGVSRIKMIEVVVNK
jgi:hypothetical protein